MDFKKHLLENLHKTDLKQSYFAHEFNSEYSEDTISIEYEDQKVLAKFRVTETAKQSAPDYYDVIDFRIESVQFYATSGSNEGSEIFIDVSDSELINALNYY